MLLPACTGVKSTAPVAATLPSDPPRVSNTRPATPLPPTPEPVKTSTIPVDIGDLRGIKIKFWHTWTGAARESIDRLEARFNGSNPWGIWVDASPYPGTASLSQAVVQNLGSHLSADIAAVPVEVAAAWNQSSPTAVDLDTYIPDPVWGLAAGGLDDPIPAVWQSFQSGGQQLGLPFGASARYFVYNHTWAEELGFTRPPATLEEFKTQACAAAHQNLSDAQVEDRGTGGWVIDSDPVTVLSWIAAFGGDTSYEDTPDLTFNNPASRSAFEYLQALFDQGCIWTARKSDHVGYLAGRQALLISAAPQDIPRFTHEMTVKKNDDVWSLIPFPGSQGKAVLVGSGTGLSIIHTSENYQMAAWLFIRWLQQPENQAEFLAASLDLPSTEASLTTASEKLAAVPQWLTAVQELDNLTVGPRQPAWLEGRDVLEDAFLQLFLADTEPGEETAILEMLDQTLAELASGRP